MTPEEMIKLLEGGGTAPLPPRNYGEAKQDTNALDVLEQLERLGDLRPAEQEELDRLRQTQGVAQDEIGKTGATYRGALQGATFNWADEIHGALGGDMEAAREKNRIAEEKYADEYKTGKAAGAIGSGTALSLATAPLATGSTLLSTIARGAGLGFGEGFLWGSGEGEGAEKVTEGAKWGTGGAFIGAGAPLLVGAGSAVKKGVGNAIGFARNKGNAKRANRIVANLVKQSGKTPQQLADEVARAGSVGQPQVRLMDTMGKPGMRKASGIVRSGNSDELQKYLIDRQVDQPNRVTGIIDDAFGTKGTTADRAKEAIKAGRREQAESAYNMAAGSARPVDVRGTIDILDDTIRRLEPQDIMSKGVDDVAEEFKTLKSKLTGINRATGDEVQVSNYDSLLSTYRSLNNRIKHLFKNDKGNVATALVPVRDALEEALAKSSGGFRKAQSQYRASSGVLDAVDVGADAAKPGSYIDNIDDYKRMTPAERQAHRIGYGTAIRDKVQSNQAKVGDRSRVFRGIKSEEEAKAFARNPDLYAERARNEGLMSDTFDTAIGGSKTADNQADQQGVAKLLHGIKSAAQGGQEVVSAVIDPLSRVMTGENAATQQLIAKILQSPDPRAALEQAVAAAGENPAVRRTLEGMVRAAIARSAPTSIQE